MACAIYQSFLTEEPLMAKPKDNAGNLDTELDELVVSVALNILLERAEGGDEEAARSLREIGKELQRVAKKLGVECPGESA
jgi:hypothetical protein